MDFTNLTLTEQASILCRGDCSSVELVDAHLTRIDRLDGKLHSFSEIYAYEARKAAAAADQSRAAGMMPGPLHGLPIAVKDLFDIAGRIGTMGSRMWQSRLADATSATVERLRAAGMIVLGKLHMVEFAFGADGMNPLMGTPWNPWDMEHHRVPGGSSSGAAVAVAAGLVPAAIGSDTGGSVRVPAAFNGLVGLKATAGRISLHGTGMLSWTLDSVGPLARSVEDCALLLQALAGSDARDPLTLTQPIVELPDWSSREDLKGVRIAFPEPGQLPESLSPCVVGACSAAADLLRAAGAHVTFTRLPDWFFELAGPVGTIIASEAYALHRNWIEDPAVPIGDSVRSRILGARNLAPAEYAEALRTMMQRRRVFSTWFQRYEALLLPTVGYPAPLVNQIEAAGHAPSELTRPGNYLGLCGLAVPAGLHGGLPLGIQILGAPFAEHQILRIGKAYQDATGFHKLRPTLPAAA